MSAPHSSTPPRIPGTRPVSVWRWLFVAALASTIVMASSRSEVAGPPGIPHLDKIAHFSVFGLLASLVVRAPGFHRRWALAAVALVSLFGITDEFHQSFTPGRSVEFGDWLADTLGAALAVALYVNWSAYRRLLECRLPFGQRPSRPLDHSSAAASAAAPVTLQS